MMSTNIKKRPFSEWAGDMIEEVCSRNDTDRPGHDEKGPWETLDVDDIYKKADEEVMEFIEAYFNYKQDPSKENRDALQWECADVAATVMMMSANVDPVMSGLRRGR